MFKRIRNIFGRPQDQDDEQLAQDEAALANEAAYDDEDDNDLDVAATTHATAERGEADHADEPEFDEEAEAVEAPAALEAPFDEDDDSGEPEQFTVAETAALAAEEARSLSELSSAQVESYVDAQADEPEARSGFFNPIRMGLQRTRGLFGRMNFNTDEITDELWDDLEETLLEADVGVQLTEKLLTTLRDRAKYEAMKRGGQVREALKEELQILLGEPEPLIFSDTSQITVLLVVGVNGVGKTTSIAKIANLLKRDHRVMLAAADTFRAAAVEQLKTWGDRLKLPVVAHQQGSDPAAVVFDAMESAQARKTEVLIVDTAGRLHTKSNLMEELKKIGKVLARYDPEAPHEVLLVLDATTGQNAIIQAKAFVQDAGVSGIILTKLDGTARGGVVFSVSSELGLPIKYIGTGEKVHDIAPFDPMGFVDALFEE